MKSEFERRIEKSAMQRENNSKLRFYESYSRKRDFWRRSVVKEKEKKNEKNSNKWMIYFVRSYGLNGRVDVRQTKAPIRKRRNFWIPATSLEGWDHRQV